MNPTSAKESFGNGISDRKNGLAEQVYIEGYKNSTELQPVKATDSNIDRENGINGESSEFLDYLETTINAGYTCTLLSLGYELGLFQVMMNENTPMTSQQIADKAGMKERYVREWLAGVVTGKLVTYDPGSRTYHIPEAHHGAFRGPASRAGGVGAIGARKEAVKKCFRKDGPNGLSYDHDDTWWAWFGNWRKVTSRAYVENDIVGCMRECGLAQQLDQGLRVLDACCGSGDLTFEFAALFPNSTFIGLDISAKPIKIANQRAASTGVRNVKFLQADVQNLPDDLADNFDMVMVLDALHDIPNPSRILSGLHKAVRPDGVCVCTDFLPGRRLEDDIGDFRTTASYAIAVHNCLPFKLSGDPDVEQEVTWGRETMEQEVGAVFTVERKFEISRHVLMFVCRKEPLQHP